MNPTLRETYDLGLTRNLFTSKEAALDKRANILLWCKDLDTTTEPQTTLKLHRHTAVNAYPAGYCCLGRACVVLGSPSRIAGRFESFNSQESHLSARDKDALALITSLGDWAGSRIDGGYDCLTNLNDDAFWSFRQIGAFIRGSFKGCTGEELEEGWVTQ